MIPYKESVIATIQNDAYMFYSNSVVSHKHL